MHAAFRSVAQLDLDRGVFDAVIVRQPVLHVGVTPRQGASPRLIAEQAGILLDNLARVVGDAPATCLTIHSGLRAKLGHDQRVR